MRVVQIVSGEPQAGLAAAEAAALGRVFSTWGWESVVYVTDPEEPAGPPDIAAEDLLIYHYHNLAPVEDLLEHPRGRTVAVLHQLAQPLLLQICEPLTPRLQQAWEQLRILAGGCELAIGHSGAACRWLERLGFGRVRRLPFLLDEKLLGARPDPVTLKLLEGGAPLLLFAGDIIDSANLTDLIKTVCYCRNFGEKGTRLAIAGAVDLCPAYFAWQRDLVADLELDEAVTFLGAVDAPQLRACIEAADIYIQFSGADWTGAGLLAAVRAGVPAIAFAEAAATEVLGDAGILLSTTIHSAAAEEISRLAGDPEWRQRVLARQERRAAAYGAETVAFQLRTLLRRFED